MKSLSRRVTLLVVLVALSAGLVAPVASASTQAPTRKSNTSQDGEMQLLGSWSTHFIPSNLNGFGVNIRVPAERVNGIIVQPGQMFDFIKAVGPFTSPPYAMGGALRNGKIRENILGGGMCSSVTTVFNAAVRAGLTIVERHPHSLYISRYPVGLDATVWGTPRRGQDLKFINDTGNPIEIKGYILKRRVYIEIWGTPDGRTVTFTDPIVTNEVDGQMYFEYTDDLAAGKKSKVNDPYNAFTADVTRTVTDVNGNVIHQDAFHSKYKLLDGTVLVGRYPDDPPAGTRILATDYPH